MPTGFVYNLGPFYETLFERLEVIYGYFVSSLFGDPQ